MKKDRKISSVLPGGGQLRCHCGSRVVLRDAAEVCRTHRAGAKAYVCARYPICNSYVMAHPDTQAPMGSLAGPELRKLRREAHVEFNRLYESGLMTKRDAYQWLAQTVQAPMAHAHIAHLGDYYCRVVIRKSRELMSNRMMLDQVAGGECYVAAHG